MQFLLKFKTGILLSGALLSSAGISVPVQASQDVPAAAHTEAPSLPASANDLVREVIQNELKQTQTKPRFIYRIRKLTPTGTQTKEYVETDEGTLARIVAYNDQPLTAEQRQKDEQRLQKLVTDPEARRKLHKDQLEDEERVHKMLNAMPDAFLYRYDGAEEGRTGKLVRLRFSPNPGFNPPNRETQIYRGMEGAMLIDATEKRLVRIAADLTQQVNFGWGIFGHLDRGGHFTVEQSKISEGRWETTTMALKFTGRVLLFKKLNIDEKEVSFDFHPAPQHMTLAEGVDFLKKQNPEVAQKHSEPTGESK